MVPTKTLDRGNLLRAGGRLIVMLVTVVAAAVLPRPAAAQIAGCEAALRDAPAPQSDGLVFKLVLDELSLAGVPDSIDPSLLVQALRVKLIDNVNKIGLELDNVHVVVCLGRHPVNPSDIEPSAEHFAASDVILEIWGFYDGDEVIFTNAVIPILASTDVAWGPVGPFYNDSFAYDGSEPHLRFLKQIVRDSVHLRAYTAVGIATRSLVLGDYDRARRFFCRASFMLAPSAGAGGARQRLANFVDRMSIDVIRQADEARQQGRYQGHLGTPQLPVGTPCEAQSS
ncbi:MAG: hypothetical protein CMM50_17060 [Rhodospirillaceae bacterium]|nr:hypothetical protein [Rhodospirillaceae bacterium]